MVSAHPGQGFETGEPLLFTYAMRRRDGERPLGIVSAVVVFLTSYLAATAFTKTHDWRPVLFYSVFCLLALAASVILALQWTNDRLVATADSLEHFDWLLRKRSFAWSDVADATEKIHTDYRRLILNTRNGRTFVIHGDVSEYPTILQVCGERLARYGVSIHHD